jgi:cobalt transporter subunit CbtA
MPLTGAMRGLIWPALAAGVGAGVTAACLQQLFLVPMILGAEAVELGGSQNVHNGLDRVLYTTLFDCLCAFGFALLAAAGLAWRERLSWQHGLAWGLAGYASFALAPALELAPSLPGAESTALAVRQLWWLATAVATAVGIACIAFSSARTVKLVGGMLVVAPHVLGAPGANGVAALPPGTARSFAVGSLSVALVMWIVIGVATALLMKRRVLRGAVAGLASKAGS